MHVVPISGNGTNFNGKVIVKNTISSNQRYLFNLHKDALDKMIKDMPFDLFVEQSKRKKQFLFPQMLTEHTHVLSEKTNRTLKK